MSFLHDVLADVPCDTASALALFDSLPPVDADQMIGTWQGAEVPTGHRLDGMLAASGWWGKQFVDGERVHPLLFPTADGSALWPLNPALAFAGLGVATRLPKVPRFAGAITRLRPALQTRKPKARLRITRYRGVDTATMIYDQLPINDVFRQVAQDTVLGAMDLRGLTVPYFFALQRNDLLPVI